MTSPFDLLLSATRYAVRYAAASPATDCPETAILDDLLSQPFPPGERSVEPARTPAVTDYLDAAVEAATTPRERTLARAVAAPWPRRRRIFDGSRPTSPAMGQTSWLWRTRPRCSRCPVHHRDSSTRHPMRSRTFSSRSHCRLQTRSIPCTGTRRRRSITSSRGLRSGSETVSRGDAGFPASGSSTQAIRVMPCAPRASPCWPWPRGSTTWTARPRCWR